MLFRFVFCSWKIPVFPVEKEVKNCGQKLLLFKAQQVVPKSRNWQRVTIFPVIIPERATLRFPKGSAKFFWRVNLGAKKSRATLRLHDLELAIFGCYFAVTLILATVPSESFTM